MYTFQELPGLFLIVEFVDTEIESELLEQIDKGEWDKTLSRHVQHFGYSYSYTRASRGFNKKNAKKIPDATGALLSVRNSISEYIVDSGITENVCFNQCIVNQYFRKQGIDGHVDNLAFGPVVVSLSLGESCNFIFENVVNGRKVKVWVPQRSLLVMTEESRYEWKHAIPSNIGMFGNEETFVVDASSPKVNRGADWRRVSITFRTLE